MAVAKPTKPHDLDHFSPAHLPHFSPRCSFFVLHDHCRADAHPPYTHSLLRPSPLTPHAAKTVAGQEEGEEN